MATIPAPVAPAQKSTPPTMDEFIDGLIEKRGYPNLEPEVKKEIHRDAAERLDNFLIDELMLAFSDADAETFTKMLEEERPQNVMQDFVTSHVPNYEAFVEMCLRKFSEMYLKK